MSKPILNEHQPDAVIPRQHPSLLLYITIFGIAAAFVILAFNINGGPDWAGLFLNISAGLVSALVVLVVIERRLRQNEISAIRHAPVQALIAVRVMLIPGFRATRTYSLSYLRSVERLLSSYVAIPEFDLLESDLLAGGNLLGHPGIGKTTWMQSVAAKHAAEYLKNGGDKVVVLFPLSQWSQQETLEAAVLGYIKAHANCFNSTASSVLENRVSTLLLDGYDDIFMKNRSFETEYKNLVAAFPQIKVSVSSRPDYPTPMENGAIIKLPELSDERITQIQMARQARSRYA